MTDRRDRCDHCGKWQLRGTLVIPNTPEEYWDGRFAVCEECASSKKYDREYWTKWANNRQKD